MRVLHVAQPVFDGGLARAVIALARTQRDRGWDVQVAAPEGELAGQARAAELVVHRWHGRRRPVSLVRGVADLHRLVASIRPDLVHLHSSWAGLAGRLAIRGSVPTVFQPHAWSFRGVRPPMSWVGLRWERWATRWAESVLCVSEGERCIGIEHGIRARWAVVTNPVDHRRVAFGGDEERRRARRTLSLADGPLVVCMGRLCRQKGQDVLLSAWPAVRAAIPQAQLVLVGDGPWGDRFASDPATGVEVVGWRDDVVDWLHAADVVAMPSRWEGMSIGMLEAMAAGRSLVASDVEGVAEALGGEGEEAAGALVAGEDAGALAAALTARLIDPSLAAREGRSGRARVEARFSLERWGDQMVAVAADALASARVR